MNPIAENTSDGLVSEEAPTVKAVAAMKPLAKPGRDDRKSCRCTVPQEHQFCELKVGDDVLLALLVDQSAGGFAVLVDRLDGLKIGEKVDLNTDMGTFTVRIVHINEVAPPKDVAIDRCFRVGVKKTHRFFLF
jgi:hypothetical protein